MAADQGQVLDASILTDDRREADSALNAPGLCSLWIDWADFQNQVVLLYVAGDANALWCLPIVFGRDLGPHGPLNPADRRRLDIGSILFWRAGALLDKQIPVRRRVIVLRIDFESFREITGSIFQQPGVVHRQILLM